MDSSLNGGEIGVPVGSDHGGVGYGSGLVSFQDLPGSTTTIVNLTAYTDNGWPVSIDPPRAVLKDAKALSFVVEVQAPAAAPAGPAGYVMVDARVTINNFPCSAPDPARAPLGVGRYVDVFGARLVNPLDVAGPAVAGEDFDIELQVRSNDVMHVSFIYSADQGWFAIGPQAVDVDPGFDHVTLKSIHVDVSGSSLRPGYTTIDVLVQGESSGKPAYTGHLGFLIYTPTPKGVTVPALPLFAWVAIAMAVGGGATALLVDRRAARRRKAMLQLRRVVADATARGRLQKPPEPPGG